MPTDAVAHYSDATTYAKQAVYWIRHLEDYGCLTEADMSGLTTYAGLRAAIVLHVPPAVHADTVNIIRDAVGDGDSRKGELGRANQLGLLTDALVATAAGQSSGARIDKLCTDLAVLTSPDTMDSNSAASFAKQV
jgi:hypothetical protein